MSARQPNHAAGRSAEVWLDGRLLPGIIDADGRAWAYPAVRGGDWRPASEDPPVSQLALPGLW